MDFVSGRFFSFSEVEDLGEEAPYGQLGITDNRVVVGHPVLKKHTVSIMKLPFFFEKGIKVDANVWVIFEGFPSEIGHCLGWFHTILVVVSIIFIFTWGNDPI